MIPFKRKFTMAEASLIMRVFLDFDAFSTFEVYQFWCFDESSRCDKKSLLAIIRFLIRP